MNRDTITLPRSVVEQVLEALNASMPHNNDMDEDWPSHIAARRALRAALEQPQVGEVVVTTNQEGQCVAVTRQDDDGCILSVIWEAQQPQVEQAEDMLEAISAGGVGKLEQPDNTALQEAARQARDWIAEHPDRRPISAGRMVAILTNALAAAPQPPVVKESLTVQPQGEQEPAAWMDTETRVLYDHDTSEVDQHHGFKPTVPLYTHPQNLNCKSTQARLATLWGYERPQQEQEWKRRLGNLLAVIHGDGGHYIEAHGWDKAQADAEERVARVMTGLPQSASVALAEEIIEYLHAHYDTEMIKELDSGDALIRLDDAIAAVEEVAQRYTAPQPPRQPLTDEAEHQCPYPKANPSTRNAWLDGWEAAERAHGIGGEA